MSTIERHPIPPIPPPPHASPPPPHEPSGGSVLPPHPAAPPPPGVHGVTLGQTGSKHHTPVYRVGSTTAGGGPITTQNAADALAALQAFLAAHQNAVAASPGTPAPPANFNITATAEPVDMEGTPSGGPGGSGVAFKLGPTGKPVGTPFPPYTGPHKAY